MKYQIFRHPEVEQDLRNIAELIADYSGTKTALQKMEQIKQGIHQLSDFPYKGSLRDDLVPNLRAIPVARKGVITFTIDENEKTVFIVSVTYAGADWLNLLANRELLNQ